MTKLIPGYIRKSLLTNGRVRKQFRGVAKIDPLPVAKRSIGGGCIWILTEIDPDAPYIAFGLCDLGMGFPELGYVDLRELEAACAQLGLQITCTAHFDNTRTISVLAADARRNGAITV